MLKQRIITGILLFVVSVSCIMLGNPFTTLFFAVIVGAMAWEWDYMMNKGKSTWLATVNAITGAFCLFYPLAAGLILPFVVLAVVSVAVFFAAKRHKHGYPYLLAFGTVYIGFPALALNLISTVNTPYGILLLFLLVWACDTGGYVFGCSIKGPKLCPAVSPNKTWAGFIGGLLLALAVVFAYDWYFDLRYKGLLVLTLGLGVIAQIGDLIESAIKRHIGVKDSSNIISGHGGIFDRIDGLLLVVVVYAVLLFASDYGLINMMIY